MHSYQAQQLIILIQSLSGTKAVTVIETIFSNEESEHCYQVLKDGSITPCAKGFFLVLDRVIKNDGIVIIKENCKKEYVSGLKTYDKKIHQLSFEEIEKYQKINQSQYKKIAL